MSALSIQDLFTPAPSGVGTDPNATPPAGSWLAFLLQIAADLDLPTTAWQPGGVERTMLAIMAVALAQEDGIISLMAQGGVGDFAAGGTVTTTALNGQNVVAYVTPDPSIPSQNPTGAPGWLDVFCYAIYDTTRLSATYASGQLAIANTGNGAIGPFTTGSYHVLNATSPTPNATYSNTATLNVPSSVIAGNGGVINGVAVGSTTTITTLSAHGLATGNVVYFANANGVTGLNLQFAQVTSVPTSTTFTVALMTSGTWTSAGNVYLCTVAGFQADVIGTGSNAASGAVNATVTQATGLYVENLTAWSANNWESNAKYLARSRLSLGARSPNGPSQAYEYFALSASQLLAAQTPAVSLTNGAVAQATAYGNPVTGAATLVVASSTPASSTLGQPVTPGCVQLPIVAATAASPIVITTGSAHGLSSTWTVTIEDVEGLGGVNGTWAITVLSSTTFQLLGSAGTGTYTANTGIVEGGDLGQLDELIQDNVVPDGVDGVTLSALALPLTIVATVVVPVAYVATYQAAVGAALQAYVATLPIGGVPSEVALGTNVVPFSEIEATLSSVGIITLGTPSYVQQIQGLTLNAGTSDLAYPTPQYYALIAVTTISVVGV
jgi:hypothetical protein